MVKKIREKGHIIFLMLLSFTPLIWFFRRPNVLITGSDTNFPLDPATWFARRFFVWQSISNAGSDSSSSTAGVFFHLLQFIPYKLGFSLQWVDKINLIFWFFVIIFSSWILSRIILPKKKFSQIIFVVLYGLNIYLFNAWENVKVANLALIASIPLGISILLLLRERKINRGHAAIFSVITGVILSGAGINPAYIVCFFLILTLFFIGEILVDFQRFSKTIPTIVDFLTVAIFISLVNSFWILPTLNFIFTSITASNSIGALGFVNWVDSLSQNTSIVNVLRMQGAWDWYSIDNVSKLPIYIPYATRYFYDPIFIAFSFLVPGLAFLAYLFKEKKNNIFYLVFGVMLFIGIFLTAGTHDPTGIVFAFLSRHVPFFTLFRSPWYIFAPFVGLSIAGLVSLFFSRLEDLVPKKLINFSVIEIIFIIGVMVYSYPLLLGKIFRPSLPDNFYISFPSYVFATKDWLAKTPVRGRILSYPDDDIERFTWGYGAVDSILNLFSNREIIYSSLNDTTSPLAQMTDELYQSIKMGELFKAQSLAVKFNIGQIFDKTDQISIIPPLPSEITQNKVASFGKWQFYNFNSNENVLPKIYSASCCILSFPYEDSYLNETLLSSRAIFVNPRDGLLNISDLGNDLGEIVHAKNSQLTEMVTSVPAGQTLQFTSKDLNKVQYDFEIDYDGLYAPVLQKHSIDNSGVLNQGKVQASIDGKNINLILKSQNDSYLYFEPISLSVGKHEILMNLQTKNLINENNYQTYGDGIFDFSNGVYTVQNKSIADAGFSLPVSSFDYGSTYLVNFSYFHVFGENSKVVAKQASGSALFKNQEEMLPNSPEWENFNFYYSPVVTRSTLDVELISQPIKEVLGSKVEYSNVSAYRVFTNDLFLEKDPSAIFPLVDISFKQNSTISYTGKVTNVKGPNIIVFDQNYSPQWELTVSNPNARVFHFTANSYENAWYIDGTNGDYSFSIDYRPQKLIMIGYAASVVTVLAAVSLFLIERGRNNGKN